MGLDRIDFKNLHATEWSSLTHSAKQFLRELEASTGVPVSIAGTGFGTFDAIFLNERPFNSEFVRAESTHA
jgi:adenylosuccinate synthase